MKSMYDMFLGSTTNSTPLVQDKAAAVDNAAKQKGLALLEGGPTPFDLQIFMAANPNATEQDILDFSARVQTRNLQEQASLKDGMQIAQDAGIKAVGSALDLVSGVGSTLLRGGAAGELAVTDPVAFMGGVQESALAVTGMVGELGQTIADISNQSSAYANLRAAIGEKMDAVGSVIPDFRPEFRDAQTMLGSAANEVDRDAARAKQHRKDNWLSPEGQALEAEKTAALDAYEKARMALLSPNATDEEIGAAKRDILAHTGRNLSADQIAEGVAESVPFLLAAGGAAAMGAKAGKEGIESTLDAIRKDTSLGLSARNAKIAAATKSAVASGASNAAAVAGAVMESSLNTQDAVSDVYKATEAQLYENSDEYNEMRKSMSHKEAQEALAGLVANRTLAGTGAVSLASNKLFSQTEKLIGGVNDTKGVLKNTAKVGVASTTEFAQEALESASGAIAQNQTEQSTTNKNKDLQEGVGSAALTGAVIGGVSAGSMAGGSTLLQGMVGSVSEPEGPFDAKLVDEAVKSPAELEALTITSLASVHDQWSKKPTDNLTDDEKAERDVEKANIAEASKNAGVTLLTRFGNSADPTNDQERASLEAGLAIAANTRAATAGTSVPEARSEIIDDFLTKVETSTDPEEQTALANTTAALKVGSLTTQQLQRIDKSLTPAPTPSTGTSDARPAPLTYEIAATKTLISSELQLRTATDQILENTSANVRKLMFEGGTNAENKKTFKGLNEYHNNITTAIAQGKAAIVEKELADLAYWSGRQETKSAALTQAVTDIGALTDEQKQDQSILDNIANQATVSANMGIKGKEEKPFFITAGKIDNFIKMVEQVQADTKSISQYSEALANRAEAGLRSEVPASKATGSKGKRNGPSPVANVSTYWEDVSNRPKMKVKWNEGTNAGNYSVTGVTKVNSDYLKSAKLSGEAAYRINLTQPGAEPISLITDEAGRPLYGFRGKKTGRLSTASLEGFDTLKAEFNSKAANDLANAASNAAAIAAKSTPVDTGSNPSVIETPQNAPESTELVEEGQDVGNPQTFRTEDSEATPATVEVTPRTPSQLATDYARSQLKAANLNGVKKSIRLKAKSFKQKVMNQSGSNLASVDARAKLAIQELPDNTDVVITSPENYKETLIKEGINADHVEKVIGQGNVSANGTHGFAFIPENGAPKIILMVTEDTETNSEIFGHEAHHVVRMLALNSLATSNPAKYAELEKDGSTLIQWLKNTITPETDLKELTGLDLTDDELSRFRYMLDYIYGSGDIKAQLLELTAIFETEPVTAKIAQALKYGTANGVEVSLFQKVMEMVKYYLGLDQMYVSDVVRALDEALMNRIESTPAITPDTFEVPEHIPPTIPEGNPDTFEVPQNSAFDNFYGQVPSVNPEPDFLVRVQKAVGRPIDMVMSDKGIETDVRGTIKAVKAVPKVKYVEVTVEANGRSTAYYMKENGSLYSTNTFEKNGEQVQGVQGRPVLGKAHLPPAVLAPWIDLIKATTSKVMGKQINRFTERFVIRNGGLSLLAQVPHTLNYLVTGAKDLSAQYDRWSEIKNSDSFGHFQTMFNRLHNPLRKGIHEFIQARMDTISRTEDGGVPHFDINSSLTDMRVPLRDKYTLPRDVFTGIMAGIYNYLAEDYLNSLTNDSGMPVNEDPTGLSGIGQSQQETISALGRYVMQSLGIQEGPNANRGTGDVLATEFGVIALEAMVQAGYFEKVTIPTTGKQKRVAYIPKGRLKKITRKNGTDYFVPAYSGVLDENTPKEVAAIITETNALAQAAVDEVDLVSGMFSREIQEENIRTTPQDIGATLKMGELPEAGNVPQEVRDMAERQANVKHGLDLSLQRALSKFKSVDGLLNIVKYLGGYQDNPDENTDDIAKGMKSVNRTVERTVAQLRWMIGRENTPENEGYYYGYHYSSNMREQQEGSMSRMNNKLARALIVPQGGKGRVTKREITPKYDHEMVPFISAVGLAFDMEMPKLFTRGNFWDSFYKLSQNVLPELLADLEAVQAGEADGVTLGKKLEAFGSSSAALTALLAWQEYQAADDGDVLEVSIHDSNDAKTSALALSLAQLNSSTGNIDQKLARVHLYTSVALARGAEWINELKGYIGLDAYKETANVFRQRVVGSFLFSMGQSVFSPMEYFYGAFNDPSKAAGSTDSITSKARNFFKNFTMTPFYSAGLGGRTNDQIVNQLIPAMKDKVNEVYWATKDLPKDEAIAKVQILLTNIMGVTNVSALLVPNQKPTTESMGLVARNLIAAKALPRKKFPFKDKDGTEKTMWASQMNNIYNPQVEYTPEGIFVSYEVQQFYGRITSAGKFQVMPNTQKSWKVHRVPLKSLSITPLMRNQSQAKLKLAYYAVDSNGEIVLDEINKPFDMARSQLSELAGNARDNVDVFSEMVSALGRNYVAVRGVMVQRALTAKYKKLGGLEGTGLTREQYEASNNLTNKEYREILNQIDHLKPAIKTPLHNDAVDTDANKMTFLKRVKAQYGKLEKKNPRSSKLPKFGGMTSVEVDPFYDATASSGSGATAYGNHMLDAAIAYRTNTHLGKVADYTLNVHDAKDQPVDYQDLVSWTQNKTTHEIMTNYSYMDELTKESDRIRNKLEEIWEQLEPEEGLLYIDHYSHQWDAQVTEDSEEESVTELSLRDIRSNMQANYETLAEANANVQRFRKEVLSKIVEINHYEGTPYVVGQKEFTPSFEGSRKFTGATSSQVLGAPMPPSNAQNTFSSVSDVFDALGAQSPTQAEQEHSDHLKKVMLSMSAMGLDTVRVNGSINAGSMTVTLDGQNSFRDSLVPTKVGTQEHYVSELVKAFTGYWAKQSPASRNELKSIWTVMRQAALSEPTLWNQHRAVFDKVFNPTVANGQVDYLDEFMGALYTNPGLIELSKTAQVTRTPSWFHGDTWTEKLANFLSRIVETFTDKYLRSSSVRVDQRAANLLGHIARIDAQSRGIATDRLSATLAAIHTNFKLENFEVNQMVETLLSGLNKMRLTKVAGIIATPYYMVKPESWDTIPTLKAIREYSRDAHNWLYAQNNGFATAIADMLNNMKGTSATNAQLTNAFHNAKTFLDTQSEKIRKGTAQALMQAFDPAKQPDGEQATALTYVLAKARLYSLMDYGTNFSTMFEMVNNSTKRMAEIKYLTAKLNKAAGGDTFFQIQAQNLGWLMVDGSGTGLANPRFNAMSIAKGRNWNQNNPQIEKMVEHLASLHALEYLPSEVLDSAWEVMNHELNRVDNEGNPLIQNGITVALGQFDSAWQRAKKENFAGTETMMYAGHIGDRYEQSTAMAVSSVKDDPELLSRGYEMKSGMHGDPAFGGQPRYLYIHPYANTETYISGALSKMQMGSKGTDVDPVHVTPQVIAAKQSQDNAIYASGKLTISHKNNGTQPKYDAQGNITGYRYVMSEKNKDNYLGRETHFATVAGLLDSAIEVKKHLPDVNKVTLEALKGIWDNSTPSRQAKDFVFISGRSSASDLERKYWNQMPYAVQQLAKEMFGEGGIPVRRVDMERVVGTRDPSFVKPFVKMGERTLAEKALVTTMTAVFGNKASWRAAQVQNAMTGMGKLTKDIIIIRSGVVTAFNTLSNIMLNGVHGVSITDQVKWSAEAITEARKYQQNRIDLIELEMRLRDSRITGSQRTAMEQKRAVLLEENQGTLVAQMIEMGQLQNIEDLFVKDIERVGKFEAILGTPAIDRIHRKLIPEGTTLDKVVGNLTVEQGYWLHDQLQFAAQMSDFTAKYAYAKHQIQNNGMGRQQALEEARDLFIDYLLPEGYFLNALNKVGVGYFLKYLLRVQKTILITAGKRPTSMLLSMLLADWAGVPASIFDSFADDPLTRLNDPVSMLLGALDEPLTMQLL